MDTLVPLSNSDNLAVVDDSFSEEVMCQRWRLQLKSGYVQSTTESGFLGHTRIYLHRLIMGEKPGFEIDHINGDKLDNRIANLRHVTRCQQHMNKKTPVKNSTGCKGIFRLKRAYRNPWRAMIQANHHRICLGHFASCEEAIAIRKKAEKELHGEYARKAG